MPGADAACLTYTNLFTVVSCRDIKAGEQLLVCICMWLCRTALLCFHFFPLCACVLGLGFNLRDYRCTLSYVGQFDVPRTEERQDPHNMLKEMCLDSAEESGDGLERKGLKEETVQGERERERARERESERERASEREREREKERERLLLGTMLPQRGVQGHVIVTSAGYNAIED